MTFSSVKTCCFLFLIIGACKKANDPDLEHAKWLLGTWESVAADGSVYESWQESADQVLLGMSYMLDEVDTVVFERMFMKQENGKVFLETQVAGQNENKVVRFMASVLNEHQLSFTNARHDFPKVITYTRINPDSIVAEISGMVQGTQRKHTIAMRRIP